ncbi:hypothetical protein ACUW9K_000391 [Corynebacterium hesseae]
MGELIEKRNLRETFKSSYVVFMNIKSVIS